MTDLLPLAGGWNPPMDESSPSLTLSPRCAAGTMTETAQPTMCTSDRSHTP